MYSKTDNSTTVRQAATANFLVDSRDRVGYLSGGVEPYNQSAANFIISNNNNLLTGFPTRIIPNEVCLDWCVDNINEYWGNNTIGFTPAALPNSTITVTLDNGEYTVSQALQKITSGFNSNAIATANGLTLSTISGTSAYSGDASLMMYSTATAVQFAVEPEKLQSMLNLTPDSNLLANGLDCPKILPTSYLDFVCPNLTQNQNLKDGSTSLITQDIIYRWYLAWDSQEWPDDLGYPIYQGYKRFIQRRPIAFPKQIRWENNIPIGQLAFQVLDDAGIVLPNSLINNYSSITNKSELEWQMTFLVSEE